MSMRSMILGLLKVLSPALCFQTSIEKEAGEMEGRFEKETDRDRAKQRKLPRLAEV